GGPRSAAPDLRQDRPGRLPRDRRGRLLTGRLPAPGRRDVPVRDQYDPGLHADQPLPDDAGRWRLRLRGGLPANRGSGPRAPREPGGDSACADGPAAMTFRRGIRRAGGHPRRRSRGRASAGLSRVRAGAALGMLLAAGGMYGVAASPAFSVGPVIIRGIHYTDAVEVSGSLGIAPGTNLFALSTEPLAARLRELPTVAGADIT